MALGSVGTAPEEASFTAVIDIIGINPFVSVPEPTLAALFEQAGKSSGPIPITGTVNGKPYKQTLMRFRGQWRLYINTTMLKNSPKRIGETVDMTVTFDPVSRALPPHPKWEEALTANPSAKAVFDALPPSRRHEIVRYIAALKSEESVERNVTKAIAFLNGTGRFVGRDKP